MKKRQDFDTQYTCDVRLASQIENSMQRKDLLLQYPIDSLTKQQSKTFGSKVKHLAFVKSQLENSQGTQVKRKILTCLSKKSQVSKFKEKIGDLIAL